MALMVLVTTKNYFNEYATFQKTDIGLCTLDKLGNRAETFLYTSSHHWNTSSTSLKRRNYFIQWWAFALKTALKSKRSADLRQAAISTVPS